jgi:uncharacterized protein (DUF1330 family)
MAGYYIAQIDVNDLERYEEYKKLAGAAIAAHGGEYVVRGGEQTHLEGAPPRSRVVILKFETVEAAKTWFNSEEYAPAHKIRSEAANSDSFIIEGD